VNNIIPWTRGSDLVLGFVWPSENVGSAKDLTDDTLELYKVSQILVPYLSLVVTEAALGKCELRFTWNDTNEPRFPPTGLPSFYMRLTTLENKRISAGPILVRLT
jgi:hypothetical protein